MALIAKPNAWVDYDADATAKLTYALQTDPAPLVVSVPGETPVLGSLELVVTNATGSAVAVEAISFTIQVGTTGASLTPTTAGILTQVSDATDWTVTSETASGSVVYTLAPATGSSVTLAAGASVVVQIYQFQTVQSPGTTTVTVKEMVEGAQLAYTDISVTTFPDGFYFNGLAATVRSGSALVPAAQVNNGSTVTLVWNSSAVDTAAFTILYSSATAGQQTATPSDIGRWTSPPLTSDTAFTVSVTVAATGGQPITTSLSTAISVQSPALVAASLAATGAITGIGICPPGTVVMFSGNVGDSSKFNGTGTGVRGTPYEGWQLCNGQNGAPDLRGRFMVGWNPADPDYSAVGATGGAAQVALGAAQMPIHMHTGTTGWSGTHDHGTEGGDANGLEYRTRRYAGDSSVRLYWGGGDSSDPDDCEWRGTVRTDCGGDHYHSFTTDPAGAGQPHENRPPYYVLAYLMKL